MEQQGEKRSRLRIPTLAALSILWALVSLSCDLFQVASTDYNPSDLNMVRIPAGSFIMGSRDENAGADEAPIHVVTLDSFRISRHEVTQSTFEDIMGYNPSWFVEAGVSDDYPVESVSWYDAVEFCNKLSENESLDPVYTITTRIPATGHITSATVVAEFEDADGNPKNGYRLPTEAQWEYAAIGKTGSAYVWGDLSNPAIAETNAWYNVNSGNSVHTAGLKNANRWGLYDLAGNVWEMCWDWYGPYSESAATNPLGPDAGFYRVLRGGSWSDPLSTLRAATRSYMDPVDASKNIGFRVVAP
jgi:formylglycine-generating enzyme required for sulfatase activity